MNMTSSFKKRCLNVGLGAALIVSTAACSQLPAPGTITPKLNDPRLAIAQNLEKQNRLYDAYIQYKILNAIYPQQEIIKTSTKRVKSLINKRVSKLSADLDNTRSNELKKSISLAILALQPLHKGALNALKKIEHDRALSLAEQKNTNRNSFFARKKPKAAPAKKDINKVFIEQAKALLKANKAEELLSLSDAYLNKHGSNAKAKQFKFEALEMLGNKASANQDARKAIDYYEQALAYANKAQNKAISKKVKGMKEAVSTSFYERGVQVFKKDVAQAIEYFKQSLMYNPDNVLARSQLRVAEKVLSNLKRIKAQSD